MDDGNPIQPEVCHRKDKKLIRSKFKDVMVKVDEDIYYLDRLRLALKSKYFEKLFTNDFNDKNDDIIEIPVMDSDTFSAIVDIIYGSELKTVVNADNYVTLLMAMDYLQMKVNEKTYRNIIFNMVMNSPLENDNDTRTSVFKLYHFLTDSGNFKSLLSVIFRFISERLEYLQDLDEFLSIPLDHFTQIIRLRYYCTYWNKYEKQAFSKLCTKWIYHDVENRLPGTIDVVNAVRHRFFIPTDVSREALNLQSSVIDERMDQDKFSRYFYKMLAYASGEIYICVDALELDSTADDKSSGDEDESSEDNGESSQDNDESSQDEDESKQVKKEKKKKKKKNRSGCSSWVVDYDADLEEISQDQQFFNSQSKLKTFLRNSNLYDITVKVDEKIYKLHRSVLRSASSYFEDIVSTEYSELVAAQCSEVPTLPSKDKIYSIDGIDSEIFDIVIDYIYLGKEKFKSDTVVRLLKALHVLKIGGLLKPCCKWMKDHSESICAKDVVEILNFTHEKVEYKKLNKIFLGKYILNSWPKIDNLPQFADLFNAISLTTETSSRENKINLTGKVDQKTFKMIINHIYEIKREEVTDLNIVPILKASETFKMKDLIERCIDRLTLTLIVVFRISAADVIEILNFARNNIRYREALYNVLLPRYMKDWPQVDESLFCSISFEHLENLLTAAHFSLDDPRQILDICSKWVVHDTGNRYCLIPRIALAISQNRIVDSDEYSVENPADLNNCSQDFVRDKLWEILASTSVLPFAVLSESETIKEETEFPTFIVINKKAKFGILNFDWNEMVSFKLCKNACDSRESWYPASATMINDSLFILCTINGKSYFHVYNFSLKKLFSLASDWQIYQNDDRYYNKPLKYVLLNCRNEIYCCIENGKILKYLFELNRWMKVSDREPGKYGICYTSERNKLYRMYEMERVGTEPTCSYTIEAYDFQQNSWVSVPNVRRLSRRYLRDSDEYRIPHELIFISNYGFAVLFKSELHIFNQETQIWTQHSIPRNHWGVYHEDFSIINGNETGKILYVINNQLHYFSLTNQNWVLKKEWPGQEVKNEYVSRKILPYENIIAIHR
ncbi:uncharacterized protein LOC135848464 [Planococcus citri]|uniref:uncharacterized protein LOC135848464 n=1 Tax=Planococcus citri TaxID=170843 RepID=UPI0031F9068C